MLSRQKTLPENYVSRASDTIQRYLLDSAPYQSAETIFLYVSVGKEPSTRLILQHALDAGKRVCVPLCVNRHEMLAARIHRLSDLAPGSMGIPEPAAPAETIAAQELDLMIVPCVCASADGKRLGHGAGYYDRFLAQNHANAICLCFESMLRDDIPMDEYDVWMPVVLTENGWSGHRREL